MTITATAATEEALGPERVPARVRRIVAFAEQRPVLAVFALALTLRVVAAVGMAVVLGSSPIQDDETYMQMASEKASGETAGWTDFTHTLYWMTSTFLVPLTALYRLFGDIELVGQLLAAVFGGLTAAFVTRLGLEVLDRRWALAAGVAVAIIPSQVFFTSLTLKDGVVWALAAAIAIHVAVAQRSDGRWLALAIGGSAVLVFLLAHTRIHSLVIGVFALAIAAPFGRADTRAVRTAGLVAVAVAVPWFAGYGPLGIEHIRDSSAFSTYRAAQSTGNLAINPRPTPSTPARPGAAGRPSPGTSGKPAAEAVPPAPPAPESDFTGADVRHLPRGLSVMLLEPYPWQSAHNVQVWLAKAETLLWYPLLAAAVAGLISVLRRRSAAVVFPILVGGATVLVAALAEGNAGTAFRHRGEFVWVVVLLAAVGARDWVVPRLVPRLQRATASYRSSS